MISETVKSLNVGFTRKSETGLLTLNLLIVTSGWGESRDRNMVFTEQGGTMLSSLLNNEMAISVNSYNLNKETTSPVVK